jgi:regulator of sigma E protease
MLGILEGFYHFLLLALGFSAVIFIHELGHFVAAKACGIRTLRFAIGFGPAAFSWRKGIGFRPGSTEDAYRKRAVKHVGEAREATVTLKETVREPDNAAIFKAGDEIGLGETEYRFNWIPLGGYVMMLGQDDLDPGFAAVEDQRSFSAKPIGQRMIVISAGVIMNVILAAILFIAVYMHGIEADAPRLGHVFPTGVAAQTKAINADALGVTEVGLQPGDTIRRINGESTDAFKDLLITVAMSKREETVRLHVEREGVSELLIFDVVPEVDTSTKLLDIGVTPASTNQAFAEAWEDERTLREFLEPAGLAELRPGMSLVEFDGQEVQRYADVRQILAAAGGGSVESVWEDEQGRLTALLELSPELQQDIVAVSADEQYAIEHLLGLAPLMQVGPDPVESSGLLEGDLVVRVGNIVFPNIADGVAAIRQADGGDIAMTVLREGEYVELNPRVREEKVGFLPIPAADDTRVGTVPREFSRGGKIVAPAAVNLGIMPGSRVLAINGEAVSNFDEMRAALRSATAAVRATGATAEITLDVELFRQEEENRPTETLTWQVSPEDVEELHELAWTSKLTPALFQPDLVMLKASNPIDAIEMGISETWEMLVMTYLTLDRLIVQRTVKVEHLKGPVGIAELGTKFAGRGMIHLLLFLAMISVNLAVINFLPIPIVDGGVFLFLLIEKVKGSPVSPIVQNAATVVGLVLIGAVVLVTFYNDMANLLSGVLG